MQNNPNPEAAVQPVPQNQKCQICLDDKTIQDFSILSCGHTYCTDCLVHVIDLAIHEHNPGWLICPNQQCRQPFNEYDIKRITNNDREKIDLIAAIKLQKWVAMQPNAKHCPTPDCSYLFIDEEQYPQSIKCPQCAHEYCSNCLLPHPMQISCKDAKEQRVSDKKSEEWKQEYTKPCPRCGTNIEKGEGCLYVTCTRCGLGFCYNCFGTHHVTVCDLPAAQPRQSLQEHPADEAVAQMEGHAEMFRCEQRARKLEVMQAADRARQIREARVIQAYAWRNSLFEPGDAPRLGYNLKFPGLMGPQKQGQKDYHQCLHK